MIDTAQPAAGTRQQSASQDTGTPVSRPIAGAAMPDEPGPCWELRDGATVLATIHAVDDNWPWVLCEWRAASTFERVRDAFDAFSSAATSLQSEEDWRRWDEIRRRLWSQNLALHPGNESPSSALPTLDHFILYLDADGTARFRVSSTPNVQNSSLLGFRAIGARARVALRKLRFAIATFFRSKVTSAAPGRRKL